MSVVDSTRVMPGQFKCGVCHEVVSVEEGGNDDHPEACLSCWTALEACIKEAEYTRSFGHMGAPLISADVPNEYRDGWRAAVDLIVARLRLLGGSKKASLGARADG